MNKGNIRSWMTCRRLALVKLCWPLFILTFNVSLAFAESTNKRMLLPGSKAQALGGAFTAVADDASAGWYNPAGLGLISGPGVSLTVNNYSRSKKTISGITPDSKLQANSSSLYPGFAGGHSFLGPFAFGWSYFTREQQHTDESTTIDVTNATQPFSYTRTELTTGNLIHAGASIALPIGKSLSIGLSEFYYRRQRQTALAERSAFDSGTFYDSFLRQSTLNEGTTTVAGMLMKINTFSLGLSAKIPRALSDQTQLETSSVIFTGSSPDTTSVKSKTHREDELIERSWTLGLAWQPTPWLALSADIIHYFPTKTPWPTSGGYDTRAVNDWSAGGELSLGSFVIAGGAFTNSSLVEKPKPSLTSTDPAQINYQGYSAATGLRSKQSETLFIFTKQYGKGQAQTVQGTLELQNIGVESESFSLSSRYQF
jgi:hypothetical protein